MQRHVDPDAALPWVARKRAAALIQTVHGLRRSVLAQRTHGYDSTRYYDLLNSRGWQTYQKALLSPRLLGMARGVFSGGEAVLAAETFRYQAGLAKTSTERIFPTNNPGERNSPRSAPSGRAIERDARCCLVALSGAAGAAGVFSVRWFSVQQDRNRVRYCHPGDLRPGSRLAIPLGSRG